MYFGTMYIMRIHIFKARVGKVVVTTLKKKVKSKRLGDAGTEEKLNLCRHTLIKKKK